MDKNHPRRPSNRPVLGFGQNGPNPRTPRTPKGFVKKSVRGSFARGFCRKRTTLEHLERSGEVKGVKEGGEVFEGRGAGKATIVEISMSCKGVVQYVPQSWLV